MGQKVIKANTWEEVERRFDRYRQDLELANIVDEATGTYVTSITEFLNRFGIKIVENPFDINHTSGEIQQLHLDLAERVLRLSAKIVNRSHVSRIDGGDERIYDPLGLQNAFINLLSLQPKRRYNIELQESISRTFDKDRVPIMEGESYMNFMHRVIPIFSQEVVEYFKQRYETLIELQKQESKSKKVIRYLIQGAKEYKKFMTEALHEIGSTALKYTHHKLDEAKANDIAKQLAHSLHQIIDKYQSRIYIVPEHLQIPQLKV